MQIQTFSPSHGGGLRRLSSPPPSASTPPEDPPKEGSPLKTVAQTSVGTMGGLVLGGLGGTLLTNITGQPIFRELGGALGAVAGGATGLIAARSDEPGTMRRTMLAWGTATLGSAGGYAFFNTVGQDLASRGASALFGPNLGVLGAVAGGLAGTALAFSGHHTQPSFALKHVASAAVGGTLGLMAGGIGQLMLASAAPTVAYMGVAAPLLGGLAGALGATWAYAHSNEVEGN